jgi:hypothetical protein
LVKNCRELKHKKGKSGELLNLMKEVKEEKSHSKNLTEKLQAAITYYENHQHQMDYAEYRYKFKTVFDSRCKFSRLNLFFISAVTRLLQ